METTSNLLIDKVVKIGFNYARRLRSKAMKDQKMDNVPSEKVGEVVGGYALDGASKIIAKKDDSDSWEITARFDDD